MWDDVLNFIHGIGERGGRTLNFLLAIAILFPILAVIAGVGYGWWRIGHAITAIFLVVLTDFLRRRYPLQRGWFFFIGYTAASVMLLGAIIKTLGILIALFIALGALIVLAVSFSAAILIYAGTIALGPGETVAGAEAKAKRTLKSLMALGAWEWVMGVYVVSFGPELTWGLGMMALFAVIIIALGMVGWELGGGVGKVLAFYTAVLLFFIVTGMLLSRTADTLEFWDTTAWQKLQPFATALPFITLWAILVWLRRAVLTRLIFAAIALVLMVRGSVLLFSKQDRELVLGTDVDTYLLAPDDVAQAKATILAKVKRTRKQEINALMREMEATESPTKKQFQGWSKRLQDIEAGYPEVAREVPDEPLLQKLREKISQKWEEITN